MILLLVMEGYYSLWRIGKRVLNPFNNSCYLASIRFNQNLLIDVRTAMREMKRRSHILNNRVDLKAAPASFSAFLFRVRHAASSRYVFSKSQFHSPFHPASPRAATSWNASTPVFFFSPSPCCDDVEELPRKPVVCVCVGVGVRVSQRVLTSS